MIETIYAVDGRTLGIVPDSGQDVTEAFQAAVDNLSIGGGKLGTSLQLPPGTYLLRNDAQITIPDGITINGAGNDTVLLLGNESPGAEHTVFIVPDGASVIFKNLNFKGPTVSLVNVFAVDKRGTTGTLVLMNVTATNPSHAIVQVAQGSVFALDDCSEIGANFHTEADLEEWTHLTNGLWTGGSLQRQIKGIADPSAGDGVEAPEGSIYQRFLAGDGQLWVKTGAGDTAWTNTSAPSFPLSNNNPADVGVTAPGVSGEASRSDHVHAHGNQLGGTLHAVAVAGVSAGFMSAADKTALDAAVPNTRQVIAGAGLTGGGALSANVTLDVVANADGSITVNANDIQVGILATDAQHGNRGGGGIHAVATGATAGFMSAADKTKLDAIPSGGGGSSGFTWGNSDVGAAADTRFLSPGRQDVAASLTSVYDQAVTRAGTLKNLYARHNTAGGDGDSVAYTVMVNAVATTITVSLATGAVGQASDTTHTVAVVAGDRVGVKAVKASGITSGLIDAMVTLEFAS